ncbi:MAG: superoxide dismutase, Ni [Dehalococcoidia bacterium]
MSRSTVPSLASRLLRRIDRLAPPATAHAHCDIPCGIYDPHFMQVAALSVLRMNQLIDGLDVADAKANAHAISRFTTVKEEHAEIVKREVRIIYGDYFKPEHVEKHKNIPELTWSILKKAGAARQNIDLKAAEELLGLCQQFAEIFWDTKGVPTKKQPSNQAAGGEFVVPAN